MDLSLGSRFPPPEKVFGRDIEKNLILFKLFEPDKKGTQLSTVSVLGGCGIGKTALARLVYEDDVVKEHFELRAWVNVHGPELKLHHAAQGILTSAMGMSCSVDDMDDLDEMVRDVLHSNKCLIVFDGIDSMAEDSWFHMNQHWFGFVDLGSRVLITTPSEVVANLVTENPFVLSRLSTDDSLSLFRYLSYRSSELVARNVAALCQGNPLLLKLVGSLIFNGSLGNRLSSDGILSTHSDESAVVKMCVSALPRELREFLAYCSFFSKGYAMDKEKIIRMWIANGIVMPSQRNEDDGAYYFDQLLSSSFFTDITRDEYIKEFRMPGLIHKAAEDVASTLLKEKFGVISSIDENVGRLSIVLPSPGEYYSSQRLRVLILSPTIYLGGCLEHSLVEFKELKSLDLSCSGIHNLSDDICGLQELRYLNMSYTRIESLPDSIEDLSKLQTMDLSWCYHLKNLPEGMRKLTRMRHLDLTRCESLSYLPSGIEFLTSLNSMPLFVLGEDRVSAGLDELGSLNNLRGRLEIRNLENVREISEAKDAKLGQKNIHHLGLSWSQNADNCYDVLKHLEPHESLQVLDLTNYMGSRFPRRMNRLYGLIKISINNCGCKELPSLGHLPWLKDLQLKGMSKLSYIDQEFYGYGRPGHIFPSLEKLGLYDMPMLVDWYRFGGSDTRAFPRIKTLTIQGCTKLDHLPYFPTLPDLIVCNSNFHVLSSLDRFTSLSSLLIKDMEVWNVPELCMLRSLKKLILFNIKDHNIFVGEQNSFLSLEHLGFVQCHNLKRIFFSSPTSNLQKLHIKDCQNLEVIVWFEEIPALFELIVEDCPRADLNIQTYRFRSLRKLIIKNCGKSGLYLGDIIGDLEKLEYLFIDGCPELESQLQARPEYISHIPCVILNNLKATYEDSKHFGRKLKLLTTGND
ncbi:putative disease resistance protein rga1 [Phtheirospermum japonicum]|uniref:Putative disease resistance protein rga1 n=1 Tax=Phtheirospermum japonicum TaxID=374723 RepID=A0A830CP11_9LAMI|nr:putative disease resistance protein rga1 [Phtheirospermum japonicum]